MMQIILTGSVAYDYLMTFPGYFREHILPDKLESISLSFLVDSMVRMRGGIAPNIAYTLALLGERPRLMATVGEDFEDYRHWLDARGIDTSLVKVIVGEFTASFFANTDRANAQIASFYPGAMSYSDRLSFYDLGGELPDLVMISPSDPGAMEKHGRECVELGIPYLYDPSQQVARFDGVQLRQGIAHAHALFANEYEFELIQKKTGMGIAEIMTHASFCVITLGKQGSVIHTRAGSFEIEPTPTDQIVDPTGVGDAFRGGFICGYLHGLDWDLCGKMGSLAAVYCLEQKGTQNHHYTPAEFIERFRQHYDDGGKLEVLLEQRLHRGSTG
jgi:adenosine kinase